MAYVMVVCFAVLVAALFGPWFIILWLNQAQAWNGEKDDPRISDRGNADLADSSGVHKRYSSSVETTSPSKDSH